jgi:ethanolamine ammonia-lyase large subunit
MLQHYKDGKLRKELRRAPSKEEEVMIKDYVMKHFKTKVSIALYPDMITYLTIEDQDRLKQQEVSNWVSNQLDEFLTR